MCVILRVHFRPVLQVHLHSFLGLDTSLRFHGVFWGSRTSARGGASIKTPTVFAHVDHTSGMDSLVQADGGCILPVWVGLH